jgi:hypothetical protein
LLDSLLEGAESVELDWLLGYGRGRLLPGSAE